MEKKVSLILIFSFLLSACGASNTPTPEQSFAPFVLITSAPNASPTPTPFQPSLVTPTQPSLFSFDANSSSPLIFPSETPSQTPVPQLSPTATISPEQLFPTQAAPPPQPLV